MVDAECESTVGGTAYEVVSYEVQYSDAGCRSTADQRWRAEMAARSSTLHLIFYSDSNS